MSEDNSEIQFLDSTQITQEKPSNSSTPPLPRTIIANRAQKSSSSSLSDLPDIDNPLIRERLSQPKIPLYSLNQNISPTEISSSTRVTTRKSRGVEKKSKAQLDWESQQRADNASKSSCISAPTNVSSARTRKLVSRSKMKKSDVSQLIDDFLELASSD
ncbi:hypothetical protein [uncultured Nostoc sp.]|uniref:hypothetical protein n=1 Tax=uncultured Nostoc sp. TaxID=340711 RepID=UPI0035CB9F0B